MGRRVLLITYNLLLPFVFLLAFPAWVLKMYRRGGFGTGLMQRLGVFDEGVGKDSKGCVYVHAVSVGENFIALKLIRKWLEMYPDERFVLVPTTATGHAMAIANAPKGVEVIYSPVDFPWIVGKVMRKLEPKSVVLIESEMWPNLLNTCRKMRIPVAVANARLSPRSEKRYAKLRWLVEPLFAMISKVLVQEKVDVKRWSSIGLSTSVLEHTGSVKFDHTGSERPTKRSQFDEILRYYSGGRKIVMLMSSFAGEEKRVAEELKPLSEKFFLVLVPRHMERRMEVLQDVEAVGYSAILRSRIVESSMDLIAKKGSMCLIVDSTGELRDWTAHADVAIIGKSWLAKGGQNPTEAVAAGVPLIVGPRMDNFEPLVSVMVAEKAIWQLDEMSAIPNVLETIFESEEKAGLMCEKAIRVLSKHDGATQRCVEELQNLTFTM